MGGVGKLYWELMNLFVVIVDGYVIVLWVGVEVCDMEFM